MNVDADAISSTAPMPRSSRVNCGRPGDSGSGSRIAWSNMLPPNLCELTTKLDFVFHSLPLHVRGHGRGRSGLRGADLALPGIEQRLGAFGGIEQDGRGVRLARAELGGASLGSSDKVLESTELLDQSMRSRGVDANAPLELASAERQVARAPQAFERAG